MSFLLCALIYLLAFTSAPEEPQTYAQMAAMVANNNPHSAGAFEMTRINKLHPAWPLRLAFASFLDMVLKQSINILQLVKASMWLADSDVDKRELARKQ